MLKKSKK